MSTGTEGYNVANPRLASNEDVLKVSSRISSPRNEGGNVWP